MAQPTVGAGNKRLSIMPSISERVLCRKRSANGRETARQGQSKSGLLVLTKIRADLADNSRWWRKHRQSHSHGDETPH